MAQPCPDCGTLMENIGQLDIGDELANVFKCSGCGQLWTDDQIQLVYYLNGIRNEKDEENERKTSRDNQS
jgi:DNA-directed RNA polymerase subunit M/transcription elongation factor TFIIS